MDAKRAQASVREAYGEVVWFGRRGAGVKFLGSKLLIGDGGKRAVLRGEHEVSRKAIAQGRPECSRCLVCSCAALFAQIARETAGAASTRSSLRPLISRGQMKMQTSGVMRRESRNCMHVIAREPWSRVGSSGYKSCRVSLPYGTAVRAGAFFAGVSPPAS